MEDEIATIVVDTGYITFQFPFACRTISYIQSS